MPTKYIFITGGVVSGLGKGISGSSIATILKNSGYKVFMQKLDPYLNLDPGTMNPTQHGEVYVTDDGAETDLDLGHYERFIDSNLNKYSNVTAGKIYMQVLQNERKGLYNGETVQVVPHVTDEIIKKITFFDGEYDFIITEIGGTIGDIESLPFIESVRQIKQMKKQRGVMLFHVALIPYLTITEESKTKPVQHSVKELLSCGIQPDAIICRSSYILDEKTIKKISLFCNVDKSNVFMSNDAKTIYHVPNIFYKQNIYKSIAGFFNIEINPNMSEWLDFENQITNSQNKIKVFVINKYKDLKDAYLSVIESLNIAGYKNNAIVELVWVESDNIHENNYKEILKDANSILVPGGFGKRGVEGKILAAKYARENNIPFLGLCLGMQTAVIEFARNVCNLKDAHSLEFNADTEHPIFKLVKGKKESDDLGGTLRLGGYNNKVLKNSLLSKLYDGAENIRERHRHRYEFNNEYLKILESKGLVFSAWYEKGNLAEVVELPSHKFFIASQFHPEFTSRPNKPNPLFDGFIKAILNN